MPIRLHRRARSDLDEIYQYSAEQWGVAQADRYLDDLTETFALVEQYRAFDRAADDLPKNLRKIRSGSHFIYFLREGRDIHVVRVLHQSMDPIRHLP